MKHEKCYLCLRTHVTLVPGPYNGGGAVGVIEGAFSETSVFVTFKKISAELLEPPRNREGLQRDSYIH